jgi:hypothetical protein
MGNRNGLFNSFNSIFSSERTFKPRGFVNSLSGSLGILQFLKSKEESPSTE